MKNWKKWVAVLVCTLGFQTPATAANLVGNLLNSLGLGQLLGNNSGAVAEIDAFNPTNTGLNDLVGVDLQDPLGTLGLTATANQLLGVETFGNALVPLDALGLGSLLESLGLTGNGDTALLLRSLLGADGALIGPLADTIDGLLGAAGGAGLNLSDGGLIGLSILAGPNSGNGSLAGISLLSGNNSGNSDGLGIAVLSGNNSGNSADGIAVGALNAGNSGQGGLIGVAALNAPPTPEPDASCDGTTCGDTLKVADERDDKAYLLPKDSSRASCADVGCTELLVAEAASSCPDADKDGVCDDADECPDTPPHTPVLANGCHLSKDRGLVLRGVNFEFDKSTLTPESHVILDQATEVLKAQPEVLVSIDGHTDAMGSDAYNIGLSKSRAKVVHAYFIAHGIEAKRLVFRYFGERQPIAPNTKEDGTDNPEGRALNRRSELNILDAEKFDAARKSNTE